VLAGRQGAFRDCSRSSSRRRAEAITARATREGCFPPGLRGRDALWRPTPACCSFGGERQPTCCGIRLRLLEAGLGYAAVGAICQEGAWPASLLNRPLGHPIKIIPGGHGPLHAWSASKRPQEQSGRGPCASSKRALVVGSTGTIRCGDDGPRFRAACCSTGRAEPALATGPVPRMVSSPWLAPAGSPRWNGRLSSPSLAAGDPGDRLTEAETNADLDNPGANGCSRHQWDASPLDRLGPCDGIGWLKELFVEVLIPAVVADEVITGWLSRSDS